MYINPKSIVEVDKKVIKLSMIALRDIKRIHKCANMTMAGMTMEVDDILAQLDKDIYKVTRKNKNKE